MSNFDDFQMGTQVFKSSHQVWFASRGLFGAASSACLERVGSISANWHSV